MSLPGAAGFEDVVLPHLDAAHNLARWLVRDAATAEDVVQDAVVRALGYFGSYRGGNARAWLLQIVRNTAYSALAARTLRSGTASLDGFAPGSVPGGGSPALQVPDGAGDPETAFCGHERFAELGRVLAALPAELRECLVLRELEEFSYKDVARITGVPVGTVMSRLWRARRALAAAGKEGT